MVLNSSSPLLLFNNFNLNQKMEKISILIVEDDFTQASMIADIFIRFFSKGKSEIFTKDNLYDAVRNHASKLDNSLLLGIAPDVENALKKMSKNDYFLITLDGGLLGGGHGRQIFSNMSELQKKSTIVVSGDEDFVTEVKNKGFCALLKPVGFDDLERILSLKFTEN